MDCYFGSTIMNARTLLIYALISIVSILFIKCDSDAGNLVADTKFNKAQWDSVGDFNSFPDREGMLNDLIKHHQIKGLSHRQIIDSLGTPANYTNPGDSIYYDIVINYGYLDPKSGTYLAIGFNKDSVATGFNVVHWKNRHADEN